MRYSTLDLINRARDLSDTGNTDFLSYEEQERYINEAYSEIYQISINRGDDNFVKTFRVSGKTKLPQDFFSLRAVKGLDGYLYKRKTLSDTDNEPGYYIMNGYLHIAGLKTDAEVTYYPEPKHLTIQQPDYDLEYKAFPKGSVYDKYLVFCRNEEDLDTGDITHYLCVFDYINEIYNEYEIDDSPADTFTGKTIVLEYADKYKYYDYSGNFLKEVARTDTVLIKTLNGLFKPTIVDNNIIVWKGKEYKLEFITNDGQLKKYIVAGDDGLYYFDQHGNVYLSEPEEEALLIDNDANTDVALYVTKLNKEDYLLFDTFSEGAMCYTRAFSKTSLGERKQTLDLDADLVYGFTDDYIIYSDGVNLHRIGNKPNLIMNYPNSAFYTVLAYTIALRIVLKQNADPSLMAEQREKAMADYFDQVQDSYGLVRMRNIYT